VVVLLSESDTLAIGLAQVARELLPEALSQLDQPPMPLRLSALEEVVLRLEVLERVGKQLLTEAVAEGEVR